MNRLPKFVYNKYNLFISLLLLVAISGFSQEKKKPAVESFESETILASYTKSNSRLTISGEHHKFGQSSLEWNWNGPSTFSTSYFRILSFDESPLLYGKHFPSSPTFVMSLYNEVPQKEKITISFFPFLLGEN